MRRLVPRFQTWNASSRRYNRPRLLSIRGDVKHDESRIHVYDYGIFSASACIRVQNIPVVMNFSTFAQVFMYERRANDAGTASYFAECNTIWRQKLLPCRRKCSVWIFSGRYRRIEKKNDAYCARKWSKIDTPALLSFDASVYIYIYTRIR